MQRRDWLIAAILALLLFFLIGAGFLFLVQPRSVALPNESAVAAGPPRSQIIGDTANRGYPLALEVAQAWQADARLVSVSATEEGFRSELDLYTGNGVWSYQFYSTAASAVSTIKVVNGDAALLTGKKVEDVIPLLDTNTWLIDSNRAMSIAMESGGKTFYSENFGVASIMQLSQNVASGRMEWLTILVNQDSGSVYQQRIDAMTGEIIPE